LCSHSRCGRWFLVHLFLRLSPGLQLGTPAIIARCSVCGHQRPPSVYLFLRFIPVDLPRLMWPSRCHFRCGGLMALPLSTCRCGPIVLLHRCCAQCYLFPRLSSGIASFGYLCRSVFVAPVVSGCRRQRHKLSPCLPFLLILFRESCLPSTPAIQWLSHLGRTLSLVFSTPVVSGFFFPSLLLCLR
jgi:hypothetical protein